MSERAYAEIEAGLVLRKVWATEAQLEQWAAEFPGRSWEEAREWHVEGKTLEEGIAAHQAAKAKPLAVSNGAAMEQRRLARMAEKDPIAALLEKEGLK